MIAQTATKVRDQIEAFSGRLSAGLGKPARRFVSEALLGIATRGSVRLSEIGRALEEPIALIKTETRLSRNLARPELVRVGDAVLAQGAGQIGERTLLILDLSDIAKPYAEKMEHLARVRDGSEGAIADGYWTAHVVGVENEDNTIVPLFASLWSQKAPDFVSENEEILTAVRTVAAACHGRGVWVIDRGGDRGELYAPLISEGHAFVVRNKGDRHLLIGHSQAGTTKAEMEELALSCPMHFATHIVREQAGQEVSYRLDYGFRAVRLPAHPGTPLWLVVVKGLGAKPLILLTNIQVKRNRKSLWWIVAAYLTRWRIEETIRFIKQSYDLEDPCADVSAVEEHDRPGQRRGLLHRQRDRRTHEAGDPGDAPVQGIQAPVRDTGFPLLRDRRRHPRGLRAITASCPKTARSHPPTRLRLPLKEWGRSWQSTACATVRCTVRPRASHPERSAASQAWPCPFSAGRGVATHPGCPRSLTTAMRLPLTVRRDDGQERWQSG